MTLTLDEPALEGLPPSCKFVFMVLDAHDGWATCSEVAEWTMLPPVTARTALRGLVEADLVERRPDPTDARTPRYRVSD